jgi:hypothetical protein
MIIKTLNIALCLSAFVARINSFFVSIVISIEAFVVKKFWDFARNR